MKARRTELLNRREGELHLPLDTHRTNHCEIGSRLGRVIEQRSLPDARIAVESQHAAVADARRMKHAVKHVALALPP
jgi:hypothetical protein